MDDRETTVRSWQLRILGLGMIATSFLLAELLESLVRHGTTPNGRNRLPTPTPSEPESIRSTSIEPATESSRGLVGPMSLELSATDVVAGSPELLLPNEDEIDGCDVVIDQETADEDLPVTEGGID